MKYQGQLHMSGCVPDYTGTAGKLPYTPGGTMSVTAFALMYGFRMRRRERRINNASDLDE